MGDEASAISWWDIALAAVEVLKECDGTSDAAQWREAAEAIPAKRRQPTPAAEHRQSDAGALPPVFIG
jgi:hypothetical protein